MDKRVGNTIDGEGSKAKMVGSACQLTQGQSGHALMLGPKCYIDLGYKQKECLGNFKLCKKGFTMSLWYHDRSKHGEKVMYHMSSGGNKPSIIIQAAYPKLRLQVMVGKQVWYQEIKYTSMGGFAQLFKVTWRHLLVTWNSIQGIKVYMEGKNPRSSSSSTQKMALEGNLKKSERKNLIMGVPPGLKKPKVHGYLSVFQRSNAKEGKLEIDELRFWDRALSKSQAMKMFSYDNGKARVKGNELPKKRKSNSFFKRFLG
jgi:hypothetical protein